MIVFRKEFDLLSAKTLEKIDKLEGQVSELIAKNQVMSLLVDQVQTQNHYLSKAVKKMDNKKDIAPTKKKLSGEKR